MGQKAANELGLYDMSGNVWEWCWDQVGSLRRIRGGSWNNNANNATVSNRNNNNPDNRNNNNGFRLARSSGTVVEATRDSRTGRDPASAKTMNLRSKTQQSPVRASRPRGFRLDLPGGGLFTRVTPPLSGLTVPATLPAAALDRRLSA